MLLDCFVFLVLGLIVMNGHKAFQQAFINLILFSIPFFGMVEIQIFGINSNLGSVFFAFVPAVYAIVAKYSRKPKARFFSIFTATLYVWIGLQFLMAVTFQGSPTVATGSVFAYITGVGIFHALYGGYWGERFGMRLGIVNYIVAVIVMQFIDSIIFFSVVFPGNYEYMWGGLLIKVAFGIMLIPIVFKKNLITFSQKMMHRLGSKYLD